MLLWIFIADIQIYEFSDKTKKSKVKTECLYEEQAPTKIVSVGSIIKQRPSSTKTRTPTRTPSTSSDGRYPNMVGQDSAVHTCDLDSEYEVHVGGERRSTCMKCRRTGIGSKGKE